MCFEFYTKEGWNPHIHLYTETSVQVGAIAQVLRRKFIEKSKWKIWNVDVKKGTADHQEGYIHARNSCSAVPEGNENVVIKCDEKMEFVAKDNEFRRQNNIKNSYDL